jgi:hypothetical protein
MPGWSGFRVDEDKLAPFLCDGVFNIGNCVFVEKLNIIGDEI